jgi:hypothetical protein
MKHVKNLMIATAGLLLLAACKRDDTTIGGKGGGAVLRVTPQHHGKNIDSCMIYIKYNTQDKPASYDDSAKCVLIDNKPVATFPSLKKGKYYLFGYGWDPSIGQAVKGGAPYTISSETTQDYNLPVTED